MKQVKLDILRASLWVAFCVPSSALWVYNLSQRDSAAMVVGMVLSLLILIGWSATLISYVKRYKRLKAEIER